MNFKHAVKRVLARRPPIVDIVRGGIEYYVNASVRDTNYRWRKSDGPVRGGPFNAQKFRQKLFLTLLREFDFDLIIETGTFRGTTTQFMAEKSRKPVITIESSLRNFGFSRARFRSNAGITLLLGDSPSILAELARDPAVPKSNVFFYLDAHWERPLPLGEELWQVASSWHECVVMIDDFQVPGDAGYGFDDYGPGNCLCLEYLEPFRSEFDFYIPAIPSNDETGLVRGCIVLAQKGASPRVAGIPLLKSTEG